MNINLREEETNNYILLYKNYLEEIQQLNKKTTDILNEVMQQSKYDKLQQRISGIIDAYTDTIINNIESGAFITWKESAGSLRSCLRNYRAGDAADEVCANIEQQMCDFMQDTLRIEKADMIVTERPIVSEDGLEQLEDTCRSAQTEIQDIKLSYVAQVINKADNNEIFGTLKPLFESIAANMEAFFEASFNSFVELHEFVQNISSQLHNLADDYTNGGSGKGSAPENNISVQGEMDNENDIDAFLFHYIVNDILRETRIYSNSVWYADTSRKEGWKAKEIERITKRDEYIRDQLKTMSHQVKSDWRYMVENKKSVSGKLGYKTEGDYLKDLHLTDFNQKDVMTILSPVEKARLWQGSFKVGQLVCQYSERDNYEFDTLDEKTKLYKIQIAGGREAQNYFFLESEYEKLCKLPIEEIYGMLQLDPYYGDEDHGNLEFGYRRYFAEYEVKTGRHIDIARGIVEANSHLSITSNQDKAEQIFVPSEYFDDLVDLSDEKINIGVSSAQKEFAGKMVAIATNLINQENRKKLDQFKKVTNLVYNTINNDAYNDEKILSYSKIIQITKIYYKFYHEYGQLLKDKFTNREEKEIFVKREYFEVTRDRKNEQFFEGEEIWTFKSHAYHTYTVFDRVADMVKNIAASCMKGKADDTNLLYGAYVLFTPILDGYINEEDGSEYSKFSKWASEEILKIIKESDEKKSVEAVSKANSGIDFNSKNFNEDNMKLVKAVVEMIVNEVGVDELNTLVDKHYTSLKNSRSQYSKKAKKVDATEHNIAKNTYGRYTVTNKSIQMMEPICAQANSILEPIDKFYKEKFETLGKGFERANTTIHAISSFLELWGLETWDLSKMFSADDSDKSILEKVQLGGLALASCTTAGKIINGGAQLVKIMEWAMPYLKKSKTLVKLSEKVWSLTRDDIQIPYVNKMMDQYVMEHYEIVYGMKKGQSPYFEYYHNVATTINDNHQRRAFENAVFSAETLLTPQNYVLNENDPQKNRAICCGVFLNLVRSGMCSKQDIESGTANNIVDKLYDLYVSKENVKPRVDIDPGNRRIG